MNPDVSVRSRGVMEKCTYCVQRIARARIDAEIAGRPIGDGEVVTACEQACPTRAIVFGNLNNPQSRVRRLRDHPLDYTLLAELNTRPRTSYLARIVNPNPALAREVDSG
jgi:molybdopterin-containing oxidoreductase family iron-sulfur binding subunit